MSEYSKRSIEQYYAEYPEHDRLRSARGQLEFERTKRIVQRFLPRPPAIVADVGGGTGPYSFWLGSLGYETHLIEPSTRLVEICRNRMQAHSSQVGPRTVEVGDARSLWLGDASCDAVFMFGPLYHLTDFFFSSRRRHTRLTCDWSSDVCSSDLCRATSHGLQASPRAVRRARAK